MGKYFGTDGFRGEAGVEVTSDRAYIVGRVLGWYYGLRNGEKCRAVIGKDTRRSSYTLEYALAAGLTASGADAYIMHVTTTPSVSYTARCGEFDCGIMISASHNPYCDNGIKLLNSQGEKMDDEVLGIVESYLDTGVSSLPFADGKRIGRTVDYVSGRNRYIGHLISLSTCSYKGLRVGLDCANGSSWQIAKSVFDALGAKTYTIGSEPNGLNINEGCGSTDTEKLRRLVRENGLDVGFAFDGDADRCIAVDENGNEISGDELLFALAKFLRSRGELAGNKIVCTVMSNGGLVRSLKRLGIGCEICGVGDRNVWESMTSSGAVLGGERSGHIVFSKYETTGDGLVTAIMIMEALVESKSHFSELLRGFSSLPQVCACVPTQDKHSAARGAEALAEKLRNETGLKIIVRPSGTENVVRILAEGISGESCALACKLLSAEIRKNDAGKG